MTAATAINPEHTPDLAGQRTWQDAVCALIDHFCATERCFSSGEIARILRIERGDFRFAATELGEFVKDLFHQGAVEYRDAHARVTIAVQVPRRTGGRSRTPAGTEVFVYAPSPALGRDHDFEVEIPRPNFSPTDLERRRFAAASAQANAEMLATVHGDGRLCIPRRAFEELSHATGVAIRSGDEVFVVFGETLRVYLRAQPGGTAHELSPERGRVRFSAPSGLPAFVPGTRSPIAIAGDALTIVLDPLLG
jgi:hypothetical protein